MKEISDLLQGIPHEIQARPYVPICVVAALHIRECLGILCNAPETQFQTLLDCFATDSKMPVEDVVSPCPTQSIFYYISNIQTSERCIIKAIMQSNTIDTVSDMFPSADWFEREIFEKQHIFFNGHPNLIPIFGT